MDSDAVYSDAVYSLTLARAQGIEMQEFVKQHMIGILAPLAARVSELGSINDELLHRLSLIGKRFEHSDARHEGLTQNFELLSGQLTTTSEGLENAVGALRAEAGRLRSAEESQAVAQKALDGFDQRLEKAQSFLSGLRESIDDGAAETHKLQLKLWQTTNLAERLERAVSKQGGIQESHSDKLLDLSRCLQQGRAFAEESRSHIQEVSSAFEGRLAEVEGKAADAIDARAEDTRVTLASNLSQLRACREEMVFDNQRLTALVERVDGVDVDMRWLKGQSSERNAISWQQRVVDMEVAFKDWASSSSALALKQLVKSVQGLEGTVAEHTADISINGQCIETLQARPHLSKAVGDVIARVAALEGEQARLLEWRGVSEESIVKLRSAQQNAERSRAEEDAAVARLWMALQATREDIRKTDTRVQNLHGELGNACEGVAKIAIGLDSAGELIHGLGMGFQETRKLVNSGKDGMIPPRDVFKALTPTVPAPLRPRPVSAGLRGRCSPAFQHQARQF